MNASLPEPPTPGDIAHDIFNIVTVLFGVQDSLESADQNDTHVARARADLDVIVARLKQLGTDLAAFAPKKPH